MRSLAAKTPFTLAAVELVGSQTDYVASFVPQLLLCQLAMAVQAATITEVTRLIKTQRQDYVQPGVVTVCRTQDSQNSYTLILILVGRLTHTQQDAIESQVGGSLKQCQENIQRLQGLIKGPGGVQSGVNTATIAHRQGVVRDSFHSQ